jgi:quercetin dioxygenase-like cupin family protein
MKIFSLNNAKRYTRSDGREVHVLLKKKLGKSYDGITLFLSNGPDGHLSKHRHVNTHEIIVFPTSGSLKINSKVYNFKNWDCVLLEPGDVHGYNGESLGETIHFAIHLTYEKDRESL